jgi:hypothetical protein
VIERPFAVSRFPITEAQWSAFAGGPSSSLPVVRVSWWDAMKYVEWLSAQTGKPFRLLTEAEWENLVFAGKLMTYEVGIRFLTDYLQGDIYFKTKRPGHNLDRARNQLCFAKRIETAVDAMSAIVAQSRILIA